MIFKLIFFIGGSCLFCEIVLRWMSPDLADGRSTLVLVMAWCHQATSHYLSQCWPRSMSPHGVSGPQWVNVKYRIYCWPINRLTGRQAHSSPSWHRSVTTSWGRQTQNRETPNQDKSRLIELSLLIHTAITYVSNGGIVLLTKHCAVITYPHSCIYL